MVFACVDGSILSEAVCDYAAWIVKRIDLPLKLLHTIDHHHEKGELVDLSGSIGIDSRDHLLEEMASHEQQQSKLRLKQGKSILQAAKQRVNQDGVSEPITCLRHGSLIDSLIELESNIRILVIGVRGKVHENQTGQIGEKLESLIRSLHRPILVVCTEYQSLERIMIAYDGSEAAEKAVEMVAHSPLYKGLECHVVCAGKKVSAEGLLEKAAEKLKKSGDKEIITARLEGKPEEKLCEYQETNQIDLTVMGAFTHTRIHDLLLGSFTVKMLINSKKPLLLLR
jgi:nucleotide-binding universal stress UspA family protein